MSAGIKPLLLLIQGADFLLHADDLQESFRLLFRRSFHEAREVQSQLLLKGIQKLLAGSPTGGINHLEGAVLTFPEHHNVVVQMNLQPWRKYAVLSCRG